MRKWCSRKDRDESIITYHVDEGKVYGGSDPDRTVKQVEEDSDDYNPGGDYKMELDLSAKTFVMELDGERITIDSNIGDYDYSPIVILGKTSPELTFFDTYHSKSLILNKHNNLINFIIKISHVTFDGTDDSFRKTE